MEECMDSGLYAAYTGLLSRTQALETAANNLANSNTNGFRSQQDYFRGVMANLASPSDSSLDPAVNQFGVLGGSKLDLGQGQIASTGNPLDLALNGGGFFRIKTAYGIQLTRDGAFLRGSDGTLTTQHGEAVLNATGAPIVLPAGNVHVAGSGEISVEMPDGSSAIVATIGMVNYSADDLAATGTNRFSARAGAKPTTVDAVIQEGALEGSNQDAVHGTMQLMLIQRQAEMMQKALNVFQNDFDKTAAEDLGRV
jgi:flagellar basal-body rod protein FlgF/flagellar basal-body rod protein FlgG